MAWPGSFARVGKVLFGMQKTLDGVEVPNGVERRSEVILTPDLVAFWLIMRETLNMIEFAWSLFKLHVGLCTVYSTYTFIRAQKFTLS